MTQKVFKVGQLFDLGLRPTTHRACVVATPILPPKVAQKKNQKSIISITTWIYHLQSIDDSILSSHQNFQPSGPKNGWVVTKIRMSLPFKSVFLPANLCFFLWPARFARKIDLKIHRLKLLKFSIHNWNIWLCTISLNILAFDLAIFIT